MSSARWRTSGINSRGFLAGAESSLRGSAAFWLVQITQTLEARRVHTRHKERDAQQRTDENITGEAPVNTKSVPSNLEHTGALVSATVRRQARPKLEEQREMEMSKHRIAVIRSDTTSLWNDFVSLTSRQMEQASRAFVKFSSIFTMNRPLWTK